MKSKIITKADIILAVVLLVIGLAGPFVLQKNAGKNSKVIINADGKVLAAFSLDKNVKIAFYQGKDGMEDRLSFEKFESDAVVPDGADNIIEIADGKVFVSHASCKGHDCVNMGKISKEGQMIACLPHKLLITISSAEDAPDGVVY